MYYYAWYGMIKIVLYQKVITYARKWLLHESITACCMI